MILIYKRFCNMCINRFETFHSNGLNYLKWDEVYPSFSNEIKSLDTRKVFAVCTTPKIVYRKCSCCSSSSSSERTRERNISNQSTKMWILLLFQLSFSLSLYLSHDISFGSCVIVNLSSCSSEIEPKMIFLEHHLIIEGSFAFEAHDRFMSERC